MGISISKKSKPYGSFHHHKIDLNSSSSGVLQLLPGVGKKTASIIILQREIKPFQDWDDFKQRIRISKTKYFKLQKLCYLDSEEI